MPQLFASPDEPQRGLASASPVAVTVDDATSAAQAPDVTGAGESRAVSDAAPALASANIFDAPVLAHLDSLDYVVPHVAPSRPRPPRSRKGAIAGLAAMSLVLGTAGGVGGAAAWPMTVQAQQPMPVVGYLTGFSAGESSDFTEAFRQGLGETGYTEGRSVTMCEVFEQEFKTMEGWFIITTDFCSPR